MIGRKTNEFCKVDAVKVSEKAQASLEPGQRDRKHCEELCQNGVCAVAWKPCKPAAA